VTVSLGGGVAGQPNASPPGFSAAIIAELEHRGIGPGLRLADNLADAAQHTDDLLDVAHALDAFGRVLIKHAHDLRILASGPEGGLAELQLPPVQPGSSAMPGKVNPVIAEFAIQCAMQTAAATTACAAAVERADLDLNVWEGVTFTNLDLASRLLAAATDTLVSRCLEGIAIDERLNRDRAQVSTARVAQTVRDSDYSTGLRELGLLPKEP
jgi:aspartate ammonia-lyase